MCGLKAQADIRAAMGSYLVGPITMLLREISHLVWLFPEAYDTRRISRIFIGCPEPDVSAVIYDTDSVRAITDVFGFASTITGTQRLNVAFFENVRFYSVLKLRYKREQSNEIEPMELDNLDRESREWLWRRGFVTDSDILQLEEITGSISRGLIYLINVLSHDRENTGSETRTLQPSKYTSWLQNGSNLQEGRPRVKEPEIMQKVKDLWGQVHEKHLKRIDELRQARNDHCLVTNQIENFFEDSLPSEHSSEEKVTISSDLLLPVFNRKQAITPDCGQDSASPSETEPKPQDTAISTSIPTTYSSVIIPATESSQDMICQAAENKVLSHPVIDLFAEILGEDKHEMLTIPTVNDRHKITKTSIQGSIDEKQSLRHGLLSGTFIAHISPATKAKHGHVGWLHLSHFTHFPVPLSPTNKDQQAFILRADLTEPGTIHPHRILGSFDLYEPSDPALRLGIQYCPAGKDGGPEGSWVWASKQPSRKALFRVNTIVDVLEGITTESIRETPRRWWRAYCTGGGGIRQYND